MSCCAPKSPSAAQPTRTPPHGEAAPKAEAAGCCGGAAKTKAEPSADTRLPSSDARSCASATHPD